MPTITIDGIGTVTPDPQFFGLAPEEQAKAVESLVKTYRGQQQPEVPAQPQGPLSMGDVATQAVKNIPSSAVNVAKSTVEPFLSPIETAKNIGNVAQGYLQKAGAISGEDKTKFADAVNQYFADRYGGVENFKKAVATDPVGVVADLSTILTLGGTAAERAPGIVGKIGEVAKTAGEVANPFNVAAVPVKVAGKGAAAVLAKTSGTSYDSVVRAAEAGGAGLGSAESNAFWANAAKSAPISDVVDTAQQALKNLRADASAAYKSGMIDVSKDKSVLSFTPINETIREMRDSSQFGGQTRELVNKPLERVAALVAKWENLDPVQYHTPEGFDFLKKQIGDIKDTLERGTPEFRVVSEVYNSVRNTIADQAPVYNKVMKGYAEAQDELNNLQRELSLKPGTNPGTALRKLQSAMRDGVQTSYGYRKELIGKLANEGGATTLPHALAGQELSTMFPRGLVGDMLTRGTAALGLSGGVAAPGAVSAYHAAGTIPAAAAGISPLALGIPLAFSPKAVGTAAYGAGLAGRVVGRPRVGLGAYQLGRLPLQQQ